MFFLQFATFKRDIIVLSTKGNSQRKITMSSALRVQFISVAFLIFIGIWLTGFDKVHWFLSVPVVVLTFAGICPGLIFWKKIGLK
jgi:hypothetical protein